LTEPSELLDRSPPHDLAAERAVLGSVMLDANRLADVAAILKPTDFYAEGHQTIFAAMLAEHNEKAILDVQLLATRLKAEGKLEAVGGMAYLAEIAQSVPVSAHAVYYAGIVAKKAKWRALIHAGLELVKTGYGEDGEPADAINAAEATLAAVETDNYSGAPGTARDAAAEAMTRIYQIRRTGKSVGVMTGLPAFDERMGGLFQGELIVLAARTSVGKTSLACQIAEHNAAKGRPVYLVSLEMSKAELATRMLCGTANVDSRQVRRAVVTDAEVNRLADASQPWTDWPMWIHDRAGITVPEIARWARRYRKDGLALVVVDYLQLLTPSDTRIKRHEQVGQMTRQLKTIARELEVPLLCLAQLNREADDDTTEPRLSQFRESGSIEQDCDAALMLWRKVNKDGSDADGDNVVRLLTKKNRNGPTGFVFLNWHPARTRFDCGDEQKPYDEFARFG